MILKPLTPQRVSGDPPPGRSYPRKIGRDFPWRRSTERPQKISPKNSPLGRRLVSRGVIVYKETNQSKRIHHGCCIEQVEYDANGCRKHLGSHRYGINKDDTRRPVIFTIFFRIHVEIKYHAREKEFSVENEMKKNQWDTGLGTQGLAVASLSRCLSDVIQQICDHTAILLQGTLRYSN